MKKLTKTVIAVTMVCGLTAFGHGQNINEKLNYLDDPIVVDNSSDPWDFPDESRWYDQLIEFLS